MIRREIPTEAQEILALKTQLSQAQEELATIKKTSLEERQHYQILLGKNIAQYQHLKKAQETSSFLLQKTLDTRVDGIIVIKPDQHIHTFNQNFVEMWDIPSQVIASQNLNLVLPLMASNLKDASGFQEQFNSLFSHPHVDRYVIFELKDSRIFECHFRRVLTAENNAYVFCCFRDITIALALGETEERYQVEKELNRIKQHFFSMASHDFRNPLTGIFVSCELLKNYSERLTEEKRLQLLNKIQSQVNHIVGLLDDVLFIGKSESGKMEFSPATLEIEAFCQQQLSEIELIDQQKHSFNFNCEGSCSLSTVDEKLLGKILTNLLSNAVKYSPQGEEIKLDLTCENDQIILKIQDNGIGIPESAQANLFEVFQRANNVGKIPGTGLGLAIVKQAVELHGGKINFKIEEGVGTTFTVYIPTNS